MRFASPLIAVALTAFLGLLFCIALGRSPAATLYTLVISPVSTLAGVGELLIKAAPMMLIATGLAVGFQANVWNIGAEGQLTVGAISVLWRKRHNPSQGSAPKFRQ